jgi:hypothetical protein
MKDQLGDGEAAESSQECMIASKYTKGLAATPWCPRRVLRWLSLYEVEEDQYRSQWLSIGSALLVAGVVIDSDWLFAVLTTSKTHHLPFLSWPVLVPTGLIAMGLWCMIAANVLWLPLFGRKRLVQLVDQRERAYIYLAYFSTLGMWFSSGHDADESSVVNWNAHLRDFVHTVWGAHESAALAAVHKRMPPEDEASLVNARVVNLIQRCGNLRVRRDQTWEPRPKWLNYIESMIDLKKPAIDPNVK